MLIGKKIKELRKSRGMTLTELAKRSGIQLATLSRIENMKMTGTLDSHLNIAKALGINITQLYSDTIKEEEEKIEVRSPKSATDVFIHSEKSSYEILTGKVLSKKMMPVLLKVEPGGKTAKEQNAAGTEKFVFVLEGSVTAVISGEPYPLAKHNTLYFDAANEHYFENREKTTAKVLCVITPVAL